MENVLRRCLSNLNQLDKYNEYLEYLKSEWYIQIEDLQVAIEDKDAWSDIKLPGRLKLEMKGAIASLSVKENENFEPAISSSPVWLKCYSDVHDSFYYYNLKTEETTWELSDGEDYIEDESSVRMREMAISCDHCDNSNKENHLADAPSEGVVHSSVHDDENNWNFSISKNESNTIKSCGSNDDDNEVIADEILTRRLIDMGFSENMAIDALIRHNNDMSVAAAYILRKGDISSQQVAESKVEIVQDRMTTLNDIMPLPSAPIMPTAPPESSFLPTASPVTESPIGEETNNASIYSVPYSSEYPCVYAESEGVQVCDIMTNERTSVRSSNYMFTRPRFPPPPPPNPPRRPLEKDSSNSVIRRISRAARNVISPKT